MHNKHGGFVPLLYAPFGFTGSLEDKQSEKMKEMFETIDYVSILFEGYGKSLTQH
jgi:hypothetical protein